MVIALGLLGTALAQTQAPIINGEDASTADYPASGALIIDGDIRSSFGNYPIHSVICSSTLIAPDVVMLAAHCIDPDSLTYGYGTVDNERMYWTREADLTALDGSNPNAPLPDDAIEAWDWVHPDDWSLFALQVGLADNHDIALLFLDEPVTDVQFEYLPTPDEATQIEEGMDVEIVGWGQQVATSQWESPPEGTFAVKQKASSYIASLNEYEMQIGANQEDGRKCHGDSGGPTYAQVETDADIKQRVIGVTSHAYDQTDCDSKGGVDTRVDWHLEWIDQEMRSRCESGERAWCDEAGIPAIPEPVDTDGDGIPDLQEDEDGDGILDFEDPKVKKGCGCESGGVAGGIGWISVFGAVVVMGRRRRG